MSTGIKCGVSQLYKICASWACVRHFSHPTCCVLAASRPVRSLADCMMALYHISFFIDLRCVYWSMWVKGILVHATKLNAFSCWYWCARMLFLRAANCTAGSDRLLRVMPALKFRPWCLAATLPMSLPSTVYLTHAPTSSRQEC